MQFIRIIGYYFQVQSPYYQAAQCNHKTPIPYPQGDRPGLRKPNLVLTKEVLYSQLP